MQQGLELFSGSRIGECQRAHPGPVHRAGGVEEFGPELLSDGVQGRAAGTGQLVGDCVSVDHGCAVPRKLVRCRGLAAADAAGESDHQPLAHASSGNQRRAISLPHSSAMAPAAARKGPKGIGLSRPCRPNAISETPTVAPTTEESRITSGSICQPSQAPIAASSLKSPYPMPSFPVTSLNAQYTDQSARYPAIAPITAEASGANVAPILMASPAQSSGRVMSSGSSCVSRSMAASDSRQQQKKNAPSAPRLRP